MKLFLVRHGEAKAKEEDPFRSLTEKGIADIKKVANYAKKYLNIQINQIFYSNKLRAKETAEILNEYLHPVRGITLTEGLEPLTNPNIWKDRLMDIENDIMLVGHLPHLSRLTTNLFDCDEDRNLVNFSTGGLLCMIKDINNEWAIQWMISPEVIP